VAGQQPGKSVFTRAMRCSPST